MCGIAGVLARAPIDGIGALGMSLGLLLAHRGPDGHGSYAATDGRVLLVHQRLAIIDCSPAAAQPMQTADGRHWLVYNGEIYNYRALRRMLEADGVTFRTGSDTEVLLQLLVRRGGAALNDVRGMFALAWWDAGAGSLFVARDRFGIKPLYVAVTPDRVAFSSEIRPLVEAHLVAKRVDAAAIAAYLRWGSIPAPLTWIAGIESLPPGTWRRWGHDGVAHCGQFTDARELWTGEPGHTSDAELRDRITAALDESVNAHLVADVPVGVFLSSGVDSALLAATAGRRVPNICTYTVSVADAQLDEAEGARTIAEALGTTHQTLRVDAPDFASDWGQIARHLDQPSCDGVNTYYVARAVRRSGVKAVLSGLGGDEVFGGYPSFRRLPRLIRYGRHVSLLAPLARSAAAVTVSAARRVRVDHLSAHLGSAGEMYRALRGVVMPAEFDEIAGPRILDASGALDRLAECEHAMLDVRDDETPEACTSRLESTIYMRSQLLRDADAMSMAHALEIRVPFVDHELISTAWPDLAAHPAWLRQKRVLRAQLEGKIPAAVLNRAKRGFTLPFDAWMRGRLRGFVRSGLADLEQDGWLRAGAGEREWTKWQQGAAHWSRLWTLAVLGRFLNDA